MSTIYIDRNDEIIASAKLVMIQVSEAGMTIKQSFQSLKHQGRVPVDMTLKMCYTTVQYLKQRGVIKIHNSK